VKFVNAKALSTIVMFAAFGAAQSPSQLQPRVDDFVRVHEKSYVDIRRDIHRHPELSGQETRTAKIVADRLRKLGLDVRAGVGGTGVVGILKGGRPGPLVAYRADMDAVPSTAADPAPFPSVVAGVRHICGHDVHVTIGLGLAEALSSIRAELPGRVKFIFQPAEERATGARAMLADGLFNAEKPVAIFGLHSSPLEAGRITSKAGVMMNSNQIAPGVTNDAALFARSKQRLIAALGPDAFVDLDAPPAGFSEDFGEFQKLMPGVFFFLGLSNTSKGLRAMPHSPEFNVDEAGIAFGIRAMAVVVIGELSRAR
jgi:metal-dependent amidase/aminoacylase/carboxypeptidase family protein